MQYSSLNELDRNMDIPKISNNAFFPIVNNMHTIYDNIFDNLSRTIPQYPAVVGCMAWLTDFDILDLLKGKVYGIVVQKEEFLRSQNTRRDQILREKYINTMPNGEFLNLTDMHAQHYRIRKIREPIIVTSIRCLGYGMDENSSGFRPFMHNKFLIFGEMTGSFHHNAPPYFEPIAVWTGSLNITNNGRKNMENVTFIQDPTVAKNYYNQWGDIFLLSEQLNWIDEQPSPTIL